MDHTYSKKHKTIKKVLVNTKSLKNYQNLLELFVTFRICLKFSKKNYEKLVFSKTDFPYL